MNIALIGASGFVGARLLAEALGRNHSVTTIVTDPTKLPVRDRLTVCAVDATDAEALAVALSGHDLVISAFNPGHDPDGSGTRVIAAGVKRAGLSRLLVAGGAGTLLLPSGQRVVDQPEFPAEWKPGALLTAAFLDRLRAETGLDWVFVSPAAMLAPGARTGRYRVGWDHLLTGEDGESRISLEDFAVTMLDEAERPRHHGERFTVAD